MKSYVALLALAGALGAAHPAQGFGGPRVYRMAGPAVPVVVSYTPWVLPVVYSPWPACVAPIVYTYECYPWMLPAPVVVATPAAPAPATTPAPAPATPAQPTPTTGEANPPSGPLAVPRAAPSEPDLIKPVETVTPQRPPMVEFQPAREQPEETLPRLDLPMPKRPAAKEAPVQPPELDLPKIEPKAPANPGTIPEPKLELPKIEPKTPAPANPGGIPEPKLELPLIDKTKAPKAEESNIPPIVLPQLPVSPASSNKSESKYRPAARVALQIDELPVAGSAPQGEQRKVGFYNFTGETIQLQIAGRDVLLPAKSYVTANVPPTFRWLVVDGSDSPARETTIPADSPGMEVLLKSGTGS